MEGVSSGILRRPSRRHAPDLDPAAERLVQASRDRVPESLAPRDRIASVGLSLAFLSGAIAFVLLHDSSRSPSALTVVALVLAYAVASRVEFEVLAGTVVPTTLVLVPMLFLLPVSTVPLCVAGGLALAHLPSYVLRREHPERAALIGVSAAHALGPAIVFAVAGERAPDVADWPLYAGAFGAMVAVDFATFAVRDALAVGVAFQFQLAETLVAVGVDAALAPIGLLAAFAAQDRALEFLLVLPLIALLGVFARQRRASFDRAFELGRAYRGTAFLLGDFVEASDQYTGEHSREVVELVLAVADELDLDDRARRDAELAALLHDVGKIRVPREIITKPAALDEAERELMNLHTIEGEQMLGRVGGLLGDVGEIVRSCHERFDGRGYPDGLAGEEIPLVARIVACCDAWSAMTSNRPYRPALPRDVAVAELREQAGAQFDPDVVAALLRVLERSPALSV